MKKLRVVAVAMVILASWLGAKDVVVIGHTMYQKQKINYKTVVIFAADKEGKRVWNWDHAQRYCRNLSLSGYHDWQVASKSELLKIMANYQGYNGLYVKNIYGRYMPEPDPKYFDVWMWTRNSRAPHLGAFVNFKKGKTGWADKKYKGYVICTRAVKNASKSISHKSYKKAACKSDTKQELTHSTDWVRAWNTCSGYTALKKDGSLWQFGKVGGCDWGQITPIDSKTGKPLYKKRKVYRLNPKKIGSGFSKAKIINGGYRLYAIKKNGSLWGWGEGIGRVPKKLTSRQGWSDFGVRYEGNGCCPYDVGLKKDGTLWRFPESAFSRGKYKTALTLKKISRFRDWKKIVLGCCAIYGVRKDGSLWKSSYDKRNKVIYKKYKAKKKTYDGDNELYPYLKSNMRKVPTGRVYSDGFYSEITSNRDGTLCLFPDVSY